MTLIRTSAFAAALMLVCGPLASAAPTVAPSFDCAKARGAVEAATCANPALAARDLTMSQLYVLVKQDALGVGLSGELTAQRQWEAQRDKDCAGKGAAIATCLAGDYDDRLEALAVAALIRAPGPALAELRRQNPARAALYEAIETVATQPASAARTSKVAALIGPAFAQAKASQGGMMTDIASANAAAASLKSFAEFIDLTGVVLDKPLTLSCEAIARQPALIHALDSQFGSTMDNQLGAADCADMLPPPARFATMALAANSDALGSPDCTGSIRFGGLRDYAETLIAVQLDRTSPAKPGADTLATRAGWSRHHGALVKAATADLAAYYARELRPAPPAADAARGVRAAIDVALGVCDG